MTLKYKIGDRLECINSRYYDEFERAVTIVKSAYPDAYDFEGMRKDGWTQQFIENPENFKLLNINNWKKEMED